MSKTSLKLLVVAGVSIALFMLVVVPIMAWYNAGVSLNAAVLAQYQDNQNRYDTFWKSVQETAQVPSQYKQDFKEIVLAETSAKYGDGGSKAIMQWFQERDLRLDPTLYSNVQRVIESGRRDFKNGQTALLDKQRSARFHRDKTFGVIGGIFANPYKEVSGDLRPPRDTDGDGRYTIFDYDIVTSAKTKAAFETGEDNETLKVF